VLQETGRARPFNDDQQHEERPLPGGIGSHVYFPAS
jgi:hypothetical protein